MLSRYSQVVIFSTPVRRERYSCSGFDPQAAAVAVNWVGSSLADLLLSSNIKIDKHLEK